MRKLSYLFSALGFVFQYIMPILLFGTVIPYTKESVGKGLSAVGVIAVILIAILICGKLKKRLNDEPRGILRGSLLSLFPIAYWYIAKLGLKHFIPFITEFAKYWDYVIIFIVIGRLISVIGEGLYNNIDSTNGGNK